MPVGSYTSFRKAAEHLISRYHDHVNRPEALSMPIPPVVCILQGIVEGYVAIPDTYPHLEPFPGILLSHITDAEGPVPACQDNTYIIRTPPGLVHAAVYPGEVIAITTLLTIQPPGDEPRNEWPIQYYQNGEVFHLGFAGSIYYNKIQK